MTLYRFLLLVLTTVIIGTDISAQTATYTPAEATLDSAVHNYNAMRDFAGSLTSASITDADLQRIATQREIINRQLERVIQTGTADNISVAKYFKLFSDYEYGFMLGVANKLNESYRILDPLKSQMKDLEPSDFSKYYLFENKTYTIKWENAAPTILEYYSSMTELYNNQKNYTAAIEMAQSGFNLAYSPENNDNKNFLKYICITQYLVAANQLFKYNYEDAMMAINQITYFQLLDEDNKKRITENGSFGYASGYNFINTIKTYNPGLTSEDEIYAKAATALKNGNDFERGPVMYIKALNAGYYNYTFIQEAFSMADLAKDNKLGLLATEKYEQQISSSDCAAWREIAIKWNTYGNSQKSNAANEKAKSCEQIAAEAQKAYEKEQARRSRIADRDFSMYAGIYPLPMIIRFNKYRDYGGVAGFGIRKFSIEVSYKKINLNHVIYDDLFIQEIDVNDFDNYWSGYRAHVAFKFGERDTYSDGFFVGPLFEIVQRNYEPVTSAVFANDAFSYLYDADFYPKETSYNAMLNFGTRIEENHIMFEYFTGIGVAYHQFDGGGIEYGNADFYLSNPVLQNRKPERFGPVVRMGVTFGLSTRGN
ncbi:MAG TPA: hypothetical protein PLJ00_12890 [Chitinophagales bacterium]|nr:hypothetical protein [Chitinophagales bacterium]HRG28786.1 hypothetical protein [Chitinophagales bacterium]HRG84558.1 hypothetical protein [Chitinophagales bacterium]HRH54117.1 hypothetical protein [Chitinophagales bacterium]